MTTPSNGTKRHVRLGLSGLKHFVCRACRLAKIGRYICPMYRPNAYRRSMSGTAIWLMGRQVLAVSTDSGVTWNRTAPTSSVTKTRAPARSYVRITGAGSSPPPPLRTTHSGVLHAANPGGSLRRLPVWGARSARGADPGDGAGVGHVELRPGERDDVVAQAGGVAGDRSPEHPAAAEDEDPHGYKIPISELSPPMNRNARGWPSPRRIVTLRPSSDDSIRPVRSAPVQPSSRIECSTSARSIVQSAPIAVYGPT